MQAVEQHPYVEQVLTPIPGDSSVGEALGEDERLTFLEDEVMKMGSLAQTDIDWGKVESESLALLTDTSKDLKVLGFLLLALQRGGNGERFALSLHLLRRALETWWTDAWPWPGEKGKRPRNLMFRQMLKRAAGEVEKVSFDAAKGDGRAFCLEELKALADAADTHGLSDGGLDPLRRAIEALPEPSQAPEPKADESGAANEAPSSAKSAAGGSAPSEKPTADSLSLDTGSERATRQSLLRVADLLTDTSPTEPLGYQLRRYAIWHSITAAPPSRDGVRSDLAAVSADRVADYREALEREVDVALWHRIEQSLAVSPFWLEGHYLSAQAAERLGHTACADAIRQALTAFLDRLPALADMTFSDGTPFLPDTVSHWLLNSGSGGGGTGESWDQAYETARETLGQRGLAPAMQLLEDGLAEAREPRARFYWRLKSAELLAESGLSTLARQHLNDLRAQTRDLQLEDWEPGLMARLERAS
ncbi:type VI secretion system protein VasJ [Tamilnaduibacter salinus]|uniref:Type VI secretion system protein VasJ n=1 Tax=Tamilnaduibacter salinus TaxID=1484056 RepID=A0A2U1CYV4_9GAMM|nr:type VI secretion system protein TssA [Tamilnaduibacter salinus]PVY77668.1 type VI secretion system protein VasJ [Tamilnaduibacter salinus]